MYIWLKGPVFGDAVEVQGMSGSIPNKKLTHPLQDVPLVAL